jgi:hypothetical protein
MTVSLSYVMRVFLYGTNISIFFFYKKSLNEIVNINSFHMKKGIQSILRISTMALAMSAFTFISCSDDDNGNNDPDFTGKTRSYNLTAVGDSDIEGTVTFAELSNGSTVISVDMDGTTSGESYPVYIRSNSASETGEVIVDLEPASGSDGRSTTTLSERNNGTDLDYDDLLALNGTIVVTTDEETVVSQADIGSNELTATTRTYNLQSANESGVTGTVVFTKRVNGNTLITTNLNGTTTGTTYPVFIYGGSVASPGASAITLTSVTGATGSNAMSTSSVSMLNAGGAITYDQLNTYNGHIGVGTTATPATYVASANIGSNVAP